jgi:hypothetical protein
VEDGLKLLRSGGASSSPQSRRVAGLFEMIAFGVEQEAGVPRAKDARCVRNVSAERQALQRRAPPQHFPLYLIRAFG